MVPRQDPGQYEIYRALATNLRYFELSPSVNTIMVTSALPGEGQASVALGTARALSLLDQLRDRDRGGSPPDLPAAVTGRSHGAAVLLGAPGGADPPNPQPLLSRTAMFELIRAAHEPADVVIVDVPPIGTVNDAVKLSNLVDGIVLVSRLDRATKDAARRTLRILRNLDARLIGVAITGAPIPAEG